MWTIVVNLGRYARSGFDASGWLWEIQDANEAKRVLVEITGSALATDAAFLPEDTRTAIQTEGESEVAKVLGEAEPPRVIVCSTAGCRAISANAVEN
jgi:hypothetical protein